MFYSGEEHKRTVDLLNELEHLYKSAEQNETTQPTNTFELDQTTPGDFDSFEFDFGFDCDTGRGDDARRANACASYTVGELPYSTTFSPEDKWPI
ncbi:unnamed protein product [Rotaria socialis]|uniref:Uncharacterized protein n=1 Tax=Rotaria socialis TaxID=392032 RepID=A0A821L4C6_9BILA|nr:unnamed protein product [Rotaria socialis]